MNKDMQGSDLNAINEMTFCNGISYTMARCRKYHRTICVAMSTEQCETSLEQQR